MQKQSSPLKLLEPHRDDVRKILDKDSSFHLVQATIEPQ